MTKNPEVRFAKSIVDYIFRWMATKFLSPEAQYRAGVNMREEPAETEEAIVSAVSPKLGTSEGGRADAPASTTAPRSRRPGSPSSRRCGIRKTRRHAVPAARS
jgi:ribonucleoside-diphosphate reductase alpha chain